MTEVRNKENDNANDLLIEQSAFAFDVVLDELLEPDRVVQAEYFLEACSTEGWIFAVVITQLSFSVTTKIKNFK